MAASDFLLGVGGFYSGALPFFIVFPSEIFGLPSTPVGICSPLFLSISYFRIVLLILSMSALSDLNSPSANSPNNHNADYKADFYFRICRGYAYFGHRILRALARRNIALPIIVTTRTQIAISHRYRTLIRVLIFNFGFAVGSEYLESAPISISLPPIPMVSSFVSNVQNVISSFAISPSSNICTSKRFA